MAKTTSKTQKTTANQDAKAKAEAARKKAEEAARKAKEEQEAARKAREARKAEEAAKAKEEGQAKWAAAADARFAPRFSGEESEAKNAELVALFCAGLSWPKIAKEAGLSVASAKSRLLGVLLTAHSTKNADGTRTLAGV